MRREKFRKRKFSNLLVGPRVSVAIVFLLAIALLISVVLAWLLMLLVGAVHSQVPEVPAFGFWPCFLVIFIINLLRGGTQVNVRR